MYYLVRLMDVLVAFNYMNNSCAVVLSIKVMVGFGHILHLELQHLNMTLVPFAVIMAQFVIKCWCVVYIAIRSATSHISLEVL